MSNSISSREDLPNYPLFAVTALVCVLFSAPLAWLGLHADLAAVRAVALLIVPASLLIWLFCTVKALHATDLRYWRLSSTYASMIFGLAAAVCAWMGIAFISKDPAVPTDPTLFIAASIIASLTLIGCAWYNWKATGSVLLTTSLTVAQLLTTATVIALIIYVITRLNPGKSERVT